MGSTVRCLGKMAFNCSSSTGIGGECYFKVIIKTKHYYLQVWIFLNTGFNLKIKHDVSVAKETIKCNFLQFLKRSKSDDLIEYA